MTFADVAPLVVPAQLHTFELLRVRLPLRTPFVASHGIEHDREVVLVHAIGDEGGGWGECSTLSAPTYTSESTATAWTHLVEEAVPAVLAAAGGSVAPRADHPMAWCGIEVALADLIGDPFGDASRTAVASTVVIGSVGNVDAVVAGARAAIDAGYTAVKVKIEPGFDAKPLRAVRDLSPALQVAADANGAYRSSDTKALAKLGKLALSYLEQPFAADDLAAHAALRRTGAVPVALDESVSSLAQLERVMEAGAADVINVKPARLGGLGPARRLAEAAVAGGLAVFVGGMLETGVGRSAALHLAALPLFSLPTDLGPSDRYFVDDITAPIEATTDGEVVVPRGRLTQPPRPERLAEVTVDRAVVSR